MFTCLKLGHSGVMVYGVFMGISIVVFIYYYNFKNYILLYFLSGLYIPPITT